MYTKDECQIIATALRRFHPKFKHLPVEMVRELEEIASEGI